MIGRHGNARRARPVARPWRATNRIFNVNLLVNGEKTAAPDGATVADLLAALELRGNVAVEINRNIVPRGAFAQRRLVEDDEIEIVNAIGGG